MIGMTETFKELKETKNPTRVFSIQLSNKQHKSFP